VSTIAALLSVSKERKIPLCVSTTYDGRLLPYLDGGLKIVTQDVVVILPDPILNYMCTGAPTEGTLAPVGAALIGIESIVWTLEVG
jgi:hypothetical protein